MFVIKVDGVPKGVHNTYEAAASAAEMFRHQGRTITITTFPDEEFAAILRQLDDQETMGSGFPTPQRRLWASMSGGIE